MSDDDLRRRLRILEDREEIKELTARYGWHVARAEHEAVAGLYTGDGRFGPHARADIAGFLAKHIVAQDRIPIATSHILEIDGDDAKGTCVMETPWSPDGPFCGFYHDVYRREDGRWRFVSRDWNYYRQPG